MDAETRRAHTSRHYEEQLNEIRASLLQMGGRIEEMIANALQALTTRDDELARATIETDNEIDRLEKAIDEKCLETLALRQPAASDLRFIATSFKIVTDLERIGDLVVNMCERVLELNQVPQLKPYIDIPRMATIAQQMVSSALDAFVRADPEAALVVCAEDNSVDALMKQVFKELITYMLEDPRNIARATALIFIAKYLERIADHATNIGEGVVFLAQGRDIRHGDFKSSPA